MRIRLVTLAAAALWTGASFAGTEGASSTFYGIAAGAAGDGASGENAYFGAYAGNSANGFKNTLVGVWSGGSLTSGTYNTVVGNSAGNLITTATRNTIIGAEAGFYAPAGEANVYLGYGAGAFQSGSNRLYIDNCAVSAGPGCNRPLVYGEFDARRLHFDGVVGVTSNRTFSLVKSQLHFSVTGADEGGWLTSAAENNFFTSSGARYDANAGGWIQRSPDGKAVIAGSGAAGFRVLTSSGGAVGDVVVPISRLHIDYAGLMGVNTGPLAGRAINTSTGAYLSSGGVWTNASSRALKEDVERLDSGEAMRAFESLDPVRFRYRNEAGTHVGFIAEDVPSLVATEDRKGLAAMDVVAVLTKVLQEKSREMARMEERLRALEAALARRGR